MPGCRFRFPGKRWGRTRAAPEPNRVLATRPGGDQERGDDKDPCGQRDNDNDDRRFHLGRMARRATALPTAINEDPQLI